jgi:exodeoxyribonuclease VII large subunit
MAFEKLKQQLSDEGLFDAAHKKQIPRFPQTIGLVTSSTGAAIRDMINIIERRYPSVKLILYPVKVQGEGAAQEIATAINDFNKFQDVDVLIIGRGGGSLEDLWAFNEEIVARAIHKSAIPIISAVGHEVDVTISDYVADLRAPTPSAAAELVVPRREDLVEIVRNFYYTSEQIVRDRLSSERENIRSLLDSYSFNRPFDMVRQFSQHSDELRQTLFRVVSHWLALTQQQCSSLEKRMASLHPDKVLERGYTIIMREHIVVSSSKKLNKNDTITVRFKDGDIPATVGSVDK